MPKGKRNADHLLLQALAFGATDPQAAQQSGLSLRTVYRRKAEPDFQRQLKAFQADTLQRAQGMLVATATVSAKTLLELQKENVPHACRLGAARANLQYVLKLRQELDLETRMLALEEQQASERPTQDRQAG